MRDLASGFKHDLNHQNDAKFFSIFDAFLKDLDDLTSLSGVLHDVRNMSPSDANPSEEEEDLMVNDLQENVDKVKAMAERLLPWEQWSEVFTFLPTRVFKQLGEKRNQQLGRYLVSLSELLSDDSATPAAPTLWEHLNRVSESFNRVQHFFQGIDESVIARAKRRVQLSGVLSEALDLLVRLGAEGVSGPTYDRSAFAKAADELKRGLEMALVYGELENQARFEDAYQAFVDIPPLVIDVKEYLAKVTPFSIEDPELLRALHLRRDVLEEKMNVIGVEVGSVPRIQTLMKEIGLVDLVSEGLKEAQFSSILRQLEAELMGNMQVERVRAIVGQFVSLVGTSASQSQLSGLRTTSGELSSSALSSDTSSLFNPSQMEEMRRAGNAGLGLVGRLGAFGVKTPLSMQLVTSLQSAAEAIQRAVSLSPGPMTMNLRQALLVGENLQRLLVEQPSVAQREEFISTAREVVRFDHFMKLMVPACFRALGGLGSRPEISARFEHPDLHQVTDALREAGVGLEASETRRPARETSGSVKGTFLDLAESGSSLPPPDRGSSSMVPLGSEFLTRQGVCPELLSAAAASMSDFSEMGRPVTPRMRDFVRRPPPFHTERHAASASPRQTARRPPVPQPAEFAACAAAAAAFPRERMPPRLPLSERGLASVLEESLTMSEAGSPSGSSASFVLDGGLRMDGENWRFLL